MKKIFTLLLVATMAFAAGAETLTVADGLYYSNSSPICGLYTDTEGTMSQTIYNADMLQPVVGSAITEVTFYTLAEYYNVNGLDPSEDETDYINFSGATLQLSLLEVDENQFTEVAPFAEPLAVATVTPEEGQTQMNFVLDEPFAYTGKNLLVEVSVIQVGSWGQTYFWGDGLEDENETMGYLYINGESSLSNFMPRMTLTYDTATGISTISESAATAVKYVNVCGQVSSKPFKGMNIIVTTHADGTTSSAKKVF